MKAKKDVNGFTIVEILVMMSLTSLALIFAYSIFDYTKRYFVEYSNQSKFVSEYAELKNRIEYEVFDSKLIEELEPGKILLERDSSVVILQLTKDNILFHKNNRCDTFNISTSDVTVLYDIDIHARFGRKIVQVIEFRTSFKKLQYKFYFSKAYDAITKLNFNLN